MSFNWASMAPIGAGLAGAGLSALGGGGQGWQRRYGKQTAREQRNAARHLGGKFHQWYDKERFAPTQGLLQNLFNQAGGQNPFQGFNQGMGILGGMGSLPAYNQQDISAGDAIEANPVQGMTPDQINAMTQRFMNPYTDSVIDRTTDNMRRRMGQQRAADAGIAAGLGAFGSSGQALQGAQTTSDFHRGMGDIEATLRNQGFQGAQQAALGRAGAMDQIGMQNELNRLSALTGNRDAAMQAALANQRDRQFGANLGLAGRGQELDRARMMIGGAQGMFNPMMQLAQMQQGLAQQGRDFDFEQWQDYQNHPFRKLAALQGSPVMTGGGNTNPWLSALSSGLGFGGSVFDMLNKRGE